MFSEFYAKAKRNSGKIIAFFVVLTLSLSGIFLVINMSDSKNNELMTGIVLIGSEEENSGRVGLSLYITEGTQKGYLQESFPAQGEGIPACSIIKIKCECYQNDCINGVKYTDSCEIHSVISIYGGDAKLCRQHLLRQGYMTDKLPN